MNINPDGDLIIIRKIYQAIFIDNRILKTLPRNAHTAIYFAKQKLQSLLQFMLILPVEDESYMNDKANSEDCYNLKKSTKVRRKSAIFIDKVTMLCTLKQFYFKTHVNEFLSKY